MCKYRDKYQLPKEKSSLHLYHQESLLQADCTDHPYEQYYPLRKEKASNWLEFYYGSEVQPLFSLLIQTPSGHV